MTERKSINIRVEANETDLLEFIRICGAIQFLGNIGSNRDILLSVDGDGSARFKFFIGDEKIPNVGVDRNGKTHFYLGE